MKKIYVAGHRGMVGSAIVRLLKQNETFQLITRTHNELDLSNQAAVADFFKKEQPHVVIIAAAKVGGIHANNTYPADFIYQNLSIELNLIHQSYLSGVNDLLFLGSSCIYPKLADQPIKENALLTGVLEPTNEPYAIAKIAGIKLCESYNRQYGTNYRCLMPTNLYGPNDNFHEENSHVIPSLIHRIHQAKLSQSPSVVIWGTGKPKREFLHVDDLASACLYILDLDQGSYNAVISPMLSHINVGVGVDCSIQELSNIIKKVVGYHGTLIYDSQKPDGAPRKLLDVSLLKSLGWTHKIDLEIGLSETYKWFLENQDLLRH